MKNLGEMEHGCIQGLPKFFDYRLSSQERVKLRTSNLAGTFTGSIQSKARYKFGRKGSVGVSRDCPNFFLYILLSQEWVKLQTSNLADTFTRSIRTKAHENLEKRECGRIQGLPTFFDYPLLSLDWVKYELQLLCFAHVGY